MQDIYNEEDMRHVEYPERKGCATIIGAFVFIVLFWVVVGAIYLFT